MAKFQSEEGCWWNLTDRQCSQVITFLLIQIQLPKMNSWESHKGFIVETVTDKMSK